MNTEATLSHSILTPLHEASLGSSCIQDLGSANYSGPREANGDGCKPDRSKLLGACTSKDARAPC